MFTFTEAQLVAWLSPIVWPFLRVLAMFTSAPIFSQRAFPVRAKIGLAFFVAISAQGMLGDQPVIGLNSPAAFAAVIQQVGVGLAIGFSVRLVFAAVELAGEVVGLQMGLNFASFFNPMTNSQTSAVSTFFGHMASLLFIVINGHLMVLMATIQSFQTFPADGNFLQTLAQARLHELGASLFASALWISLPMVALLTFVNLGMGIVSRIAPQMNIYAVGFPVTLTMGIVGMIATLPMLEQPILELLQRMISLFVK